MCCSSFSTAREDRKREKARLAKNWLRFLTAHSSNLFERDFDLLQLVELLAYVDFDIVFLEEAFVQSPFQETSFLF